MVRRVSMEVAWKLGRANRHLRGERQELDRRLQRLAQPLIHGDGQLEPAQLDEFGHLPAGDRTDSQPVGCFGLKQGQVIRR
jgi:hypothetical protein